MNNFKGLFLKSLFFFLFNIPTLSHGINHCNISYNLDFSNTDLNNFSWDYQTIPNIYIDSMEGIINNKYPICFDQIPTPIFVNPFHLTLSQQIFIPKGLSCSDTIQISIYNKCCNLSEAQLRIFCLDENDSLLHVDSININNDNCWMNQCLTIPYVDIDKILIGIYALGYDIPHSQWRDAQKLWIDRIGITVNNQSIEMYTFCPKPLEEDFNAEKLIPLSLYDENLYTQIPISDSVIIVGIGESMHGSKTINQAEVLLAKSLIQNNNCKLVLIEANMYEMFLANLYIHGLAKEDDFSILHEVSSYTAQFSTDVFTDFLIWLRKYNETVNNKVSIHGILDIDYNTWANPLFDYLYTFYNKQNEEVILPLLQSVYNKDPDVLMVVKGSLSLQQIMGEKFYSDFVYGLTKATLFFKNDKQPLSTLNTIFHKIVQRDYSMFENAEYFLSKNNKNGETACVLAHRGHIDNIGNGFPYLRSMGYYLKEKYGVKYFNIGIFAGLGNLLSHDFSEGNKTLCGIILPAPWKYSIEALCYTVSYPCFYYPTLELKSSNYFYREIGNTYINSNQYVYGSLTNRIDGLIYMSQVEASERPMYTDDMKLTISRINKHINILKKYNSKT